MFQQHSTRVANINIPDFEQEDLYEKTELFKDDVFLSEWIIRLLVSLKIEVTCIVNSIITTQQFLLHFFCVFIVSILIRISKVFLDVIAFS